MVDLYAILQLVSATICHWFETSSTTLATDTSYSSIKAWTFLGALYTSPSTAFDNLVTLSETWLSWIGVGAASKNNLKINYCGQFGDI